MPTPSRATRPESGTLVARIVRLSPLFHRCLEAVGARKGTQERASVGATIAALAEAAELPGLLDTVALMPPTGQANVRIELRREVVLEVLEETFQIHRDLQAIPASEAWLAQSIGISRHLVMKLLLACPGNRRLPARTDAALPRTEMKETQEPVGEVMCLSKRPREQGDYL